MINLCSILLNNLPHQTGEEPFNYPIDLDGVEINFQKESYLGRRFNLEVHNNLSC